MHSTIVNFTEILQMLHFLSILFISRHMNFAQTLFNSFYTAYLYTDRLSPKLHTTIKQCRVLHSYLRAKTEMLNAHDLLIKLSLRPFIICIYSLKYKEM